MARKRKKQYGRGEVNKRGAGLAIRWREPVLMPDGSIKHVRRYLALGSVSRDEANRRLSEKLVESGSNRPVRVDHSNLSSFFPHSDNDGRF